MSSPSAEPVPQAAPAPVDGDAQALLGFVAERDVDCPACGYNLRQLQRPVCPECGNGLRLSVGLSERRIGAWVAALVAASLAATLGLFMWPYILFEGLPTLAEIVREGLMFAVCFFWCLAAPPLVIALLLGRRRSWRLPQPVQRSIAAAAAGLDLLFLAWMLAMILRWW